MYAWTFRRLPGPVWLRAVEMVVLGAVAVTVLFTWGFPWFAAVIGLSSDPGIA